MLVELGLGDILKEGLEAPRYRIWDRETRETIVEFDLTELSDDSHTHSYYSMNSIKRSEKFLIYLAAKPVSISSSSMKFERSNRKVITLMSRLNSLMVQ